MNISKVVQEFVVVTYWSAEGAEAMLKVQTVVALFPIAKLAEGAIRSLLQDGIDIQHLSIAALQNPTLAYKKATGSIRYRGEQGEAWGGPWALLEDSALYDVPGLGPVRLAGPIVFWMEAILEREIAYQGVTALGAGLVSIGVPVAMAVKYEQALMKQQSLLLVHGRTKVVVEARNIMAAALPASLMIHHHKTLPLFGLPQFN